MPLLDQLRARRDEILALAAECGLKDIRVFGSVARGEERPDSDIDFLVSYIPESNKGLEVFGFPQALERMFKRRIDLIFESGLYHRMRNRVLREATPL